jgi:Fe-S oxidoreductase
MNVINPAAERLFGIPGYGLGWTLFIVSMAVFSYTMYRRYQLIRESRPDPRLSDVGKRIADLMTFGFFQKRQPRYPVAGLIHIVIFWGFVVLGLRSIDLVSQGLNIPFLQPIMASGFGAVYNTLKDIFELAVLLACTYAAYRRLLVRPKRYEGSHMGEALLVLGIISFLMISDMLYEGSTLVALGPEATHPWLPAAQIGAAFVAGSTPETLRSICLGSYWLHLFAFFFFLNFLPIGKHFHIITALPNVFLKKQGKGSLKPARWDVENFEDVETCGVGEFKEFTWKHILDFYSCTECGRCTENCPANAAGRPLSPKLLTLKLRDYGYGNVPLMNTGGDDTAKENVAMVGDIVTAEEIWSCTTCGACEEECPVFIEYIDKIVDMRRHLIENSKNPPTFNKVFMNFETTGNPFGKPPEKRVEWLKDLKNTPVKIMNEGDQTDVLFYVDGYGSYDPGAQKVTAAIAKGLDRAGVVFGILGELEKDTGHQIRRMGEEGLFQFLMEENMEVLNGIQFNRIVTADPHAFNTLKNDYSLNVKVAHYTEMFADLVAQGKLKLLKNPEAGKVYTYHDPCYLGRHNGIYDAPRQLLSAIPGVKLVEMERRKDRSFCCGGGDVILWHEIEEEKVRPAELRVKMAREAGADVMVTACPFCLIHFEDAIKGMGLEDEMKVVDLMSLVISAL